MIPTLIHFIWLGTTPLPDVFASNIDEWHKLHPGWGVRVWRDTDIASLGILLADLPFRMAPSFGTKSDILRMEILRRFGGVYADTDTRPRKSIESIMVPGVSLFYADEKGGRPTNALIACTPEHPAVIRYLNAVRSAFPWRMAPRTNKLSTWFTSVLESTGPRAWDRVIHRHLGSRHMHKDCFAEGRQIGVAINESTVAWLPEIACCRPGRVTSETVIEHHFAHSWNHGSPNPDDDEIIYAEMMQDIYGLEEIPLRDGAVIFDIGAHKGLMALMMRSLWPTAEIECWEPFPDNYASLLKNTAGRNIQAINRAAARHGEIDVLFRGAPAGQSGRGGTFVTPDNQHWEDTIVVPGMSVASRLIQKGGVVDLLKLDCEGAEGMVVEELHAQGLLDRVYHLRGETHSCEARDIMQRCLEPTHRWRFVQDQQGPHLGLFYADSIRVT